MTCLGKFWLCVVGNKQTGLIFHLSLSPSSLGCLADA